MLCYLMILTGEVAHFYSLHVMNYNINVREEDLSHTYFEDIMNKQIMFCLTLVSTRAHFANFYYLQRLPIQLYIQL